MDRTEPFNTGLNKEQLSTIFQRILNGMDNEQINVKFAEIQTKIDNLETKISALEKEQYKWIEL